MTLQQRLAAAKAELQTAGISDSESRIDVDLFARTILDWDHGRLILESAAAMHRRTGATVLQLGRQAARVTNRRPTSSAVREFWGLDFISVTQRC